MWVQATPGSPGQDELSLLRTKCSRKAKNPLLPYNRPLHTQVLSFMFISADGEEGQGRGEGPGHRGLCRSSQTPTPRTCSPGALDSFKQRKDLISLPALCAQLSSSAAGKALGRDRRHTPEANLVFAHVVLPCTADPCARPESCLVQSAPPLQRSRVVFLLKFVFIS